MARGVNKVILIGNLGADPEVRYMPNGSAVANISLATSTAWRDKQSGGLLERTEWHRIAFFNRLAEIVGEFLCKGSKIYIEGSLRTRKWQDKNGMDRYTTEIVANEMQMLENCRNNNNNNSHHIEHHGEHHPHQGSVHKPQPQYGDNTMLQDHDMPEAVMSGPMDFEDDIPF